MPVLDFSATEALRDESRALVAEAKAAVARLQRTRESLAIFHEVRSRAAESRLAENFATLQGNNDRIRKVIEANHGTSHPALRSHPASQRPHPVRQGINVGDALAPAAALLELGAPDEAWETLDQLNDDQQASAEVLAVRAKVFLALGMPGMAELVAFAIQAGSPGWAHRHLLAAQALARLGLTGRAKELARFACALQPELKREMSKSEELAGLLHAEAH